MQRMCKACGEWHDLEYFPQHCLWELGARWSRKFGTAPNVISDCMDGMKHMGTGEYITSKAKFRQATKASGCVEIGNEPIKPRIPIKLDSGKRRDNIRKAIYYLRNGH